MRGYYASLAVVGDSITEGMAPFLGEPAKLAGVNLLGVYSMSGSSAKDWAEKLWMHSIVDRAHPNIVIIALGTNPQERDEYQYAGLVALLCDQSQHAGAAEVYFVGPFAEDERGARNRAVRWSVAAPNAIDGYGLARGLPRVGEGGVHFTPDGYRKLAGRLIDRVKPAIVRAKRPGRSLLASSLLVGAGAATQLGGKWWIPALLPLVPP